MLFQVIFTFVIISLTTAKSDTCTGCFSPITTDWKTDAILKLVVEEALRGSITYLTETFGIQDDDDDDDESNTFSLQQVSDFESQVVAGVNYRMSLEIRCQIHQHFTSCFFN